MTAEKKKKKRKKKEREKMEKKMTRKKKKKKNHEQNNNKRRLFRHVLIYLEFSSLLTHLVPSIIIQHFSLAFDNIFT